MTNIIIGQLYNNFIKQQDGRGDSKVKSTNNILAYWNSKIKKATTKYIKSDPKRK